MRTFVASGRLVLIKMEVVISLLAGACKPSIVIKLRTGLENRQKFNVQPKLHVRDVNTDLDLSAKTVWNLLQFQMMEWNVYHLRVILGISLRRMVTARDVILSRKVKMDKQNVVRTSVKLNSSCQKMAHASFVQIIINAGNQLPSLNGAHDCTLHCKGAFTNYVDKFLIFLDHLPP